MKDFKLDLRVIKEENSYFYFVCLNYIGKNKDIRESIETVKRETFFYEDLGDDPALTPEDYCIFNMVLTIGKMNKIEGSYYLDEEDNDSITFSMKSDCHIGSLYNNTLKTSLKNFTEIKNLKGYAEVMLCVVLNDIIKRGLLNMSSIITLEASGAIEGKGMEGLVNYYEKLGFMQAFPDLLNIGLKNSLVPMKATIGDIIQKCKISNKSKKIEQIMKELIVREF